MGNLILTNCKTKCLENYLAQYGEKAEKIIISTAFFTENELIIKWLASGKNVELFVSLRPPTNYDAIKEIVEFKNLSIRFLGNTFHSKFYVFYIQQKPYACIIGSSDFTIGGLISNFETNVILTRNDYLNEIEKHIVLIQDKSELLDGFVLDKYKEIYRDSQIWEKDIVLRDLYSEFRTNNLKWKNHNSLPLDIVYNEVDIHDRLSDIWSSYKKKLHEATSIQSDQAPRKFKLDVTIGVGDIFIQNYCLPKKNKVQIRLMIKNNPDGVYKFLEKRKYNIHQDIGKPLFWNAAWNIKRLELEMDTDFYNTVKLNDAINWLVENTVLFYTVFPGYLKDAPRNAQ